MLHIPLLLHAHVPDSDNIACYIIIPSWLPALRTLTTLSCMLLPCIICAVRLLINEMFYCCSRLLDCWLPKICVLCVGLRILPSLA